MQTRKWLIWIFVVPCALSGCGLADLAGGDTAAPASSAPASSAPASSAPAEEPARSDPEPGSGTWTRGDSKPLATYTHKEFYGKERATIEVTVVSLKRRGGLLDLVLSVTGRHPVHSVISLGTILNTPVTLVDRVNLKQHRVVTSADGRDLQPKNTSLRVDQPTTLTFTFAAPPPDVAVMDLNISTWPPFRDLPVAS